MWGGGVGEGGMGDRLIVIRSKMSSYLLHIL
jgi:hypothetical protein